MDTRHRLAINGYGRIGRGVLRALFESAHRHRMQVVAINELADLHTMRYLTRYDSTHGRFPGEVDAGDDALIINGEPIRVLHEPDPARLPWREAGVDLVLECTGEFDHRDSAARHLAAGAARVLVSRPVLEADATVIYGVNQQALCPDARVVSNASCTTNCIVPVIHALDAAFGVESGVITTIHSAMNDQPVLDAYHHTDLRKTRAALQSIIPVDTALARGIDRLLPALAGRFEAQAMRVPTLNVSCMDMSVWLRRGVTVAEVNRALQEAAAGFDGVLGVTTEPLASIDFNHDPRSGIVDMSQTRVAGDHLVKVLVWFDNEWGFANRMLDVAAHWFSTSPSR